VRGTRTCDGMRKARDDVLEFCARLDMARLVERRGKDGAPGQWISRTRSTMPRGMEPGPR
jgi:hypothetical protein